MRSIKFGQGPAGCARDRALVLHLGRSRDQTNNSYRDGRREPPGDTEGEWSRAQGCGAIQAYLEWMPVRDPVAGRARESIWRKFEIGDLATLMLLESRLVGRVAIDLTLDEVFLAADAEQARGCCGAEREAGNDPNRTMLGPEQEAWLADAAEAINGRRTGKKWQVLGNQVTMAKVKIPNLADRADARAVRAGARPASKRSWSTQPAMAWSGTSTPGAVSRRRASGSTNRPRTANAQAGRR
jgi:phosphodiesterase/alkaline phosphatase D-like protein